MLHTARSAELWANKHHKALNKGLGVCSLEPTKPMTEAEKAERYRTGRFAEMTEAQAGL